jgi:hydrogenase maturation protein HypF
MAERDAERTATPRERLGVEIQGLVQGVGFRPFVYRLATDLGLAGWVLNDTRGVFIEAEGPRATLESFLARLPREKPALARLDALRSAWLPPAGFDRFEIRHSDARGEKTVLVLPEVATCGECLADVREAGNRRHRYPFTNCTNCGPRFSIIQALPYDRPNTTMSRFALCAACRAEYENPLDRRFHAQPNACPACGPQLELWAPDGAVLASGDEALRATAAALRDGRIAAVKGIGGFHLMVDARDAAAVARLRERKPRLEKPFAVLASDVAQARALCAVDEAAAAALSGPEAPIVLLPRRAGAPVADNVAPGLATLGVMIASNPLHHLLTAELGFPVVATSGNLTDEPIATDEREALARLGHIADVFLVHDRPIERHVDDSVGWQVGGEFALLRRARGFAPLPVRVAREFPCVLAVGGHLKSAVALSVGQRVFLSQHIGDLETPEAMAAFERVIADFLRLYEAIPAAIAHDLHPDYVSTQWARRTAEERDVRLVPVQHHHAHLAACLAEHGEPGRALGVIWDSTGYGPDGTVWGGEFLLGDASGFTRVAHLRPLRIPGGEAAIHEPRRSALALLWEIYGEAALAREDLPAIASFSPAERRVLGHMLSRGINAPVTTSAGRLFDGLAALVGLHPRVTYEAQAAIALEFAADAGRRGAYPVGLGRGPAAGATPAGGAAPLTVDWRPLVEAGLADLARGADRGVIAARIHAGLAEAIAAVAREVDEPRVVLSGGCMQNRLLLEGAAARLRAAGHEVLLHRQVPPNDGGIALGQAAVAAATLAGERG